MKLDLELSGLNTVHSVLSLARVKELRVRLSLHKPVLDKYQFVFNSFNNTSATWHIDEIQMELMEMLK